MFGSQAIAQREEIERLKAALKETREALAVNEHLLRRYRQETPLGHQPRMIAHSADAALDVTSTTITRISELTDD